MKTRVLMVATTLLIAGLGVAQEPAATQEAVRWTYRGIDGLAIALQEARGTSRRLLVGISGSPG
jgi:hypothetical protein